MPPLNFGVSEKEVALTIEKMEDDSMSQSFLISNEPLYVNHFNSLFEELWKNSVDAKDRIKAIEDGVDTEGIEIIQNPAEIQKITFDLVKSASEEILIVLATANAFHRQEDLGAMQFLKEASNERDVKIRILTPADNLIVKTSQRLSEQQEQEQQSQSQSPKPQKINIHFIEPYLQTKVSLLIVDRKFSLAVELKDDAAHKSYEAMGLATYSNSKPTVFSYVSIFESLWKQTELYEGLQEIDKLKDEFINIAAHELRTPIQPILGVSGVLRSETKDSKQQELLDVIIRNAKRLQRLSQDILDVARIESHTLTLKKEIFNLNDIISNGISDIMNQVIVKENKESSIKLEFTNSVKWKVDEDEEVNALPIVEADKDRISQVISNLLANAVKFTNEGVIRIAAEKNNGEILVSIKDTGTGVDPEILPRLFTKFVTKPETGGTGLGLFISKSIVEAHGGRIWAENNTDGKGATFYFSLPLIR
jgi:signal transduction histidine kinase